MKKYCRIIITIILCSIGLIQQITYVSERYFQFRTATVIDMIVPTVIIFPSLSACFKIHDILNLTLVRDSYPNLNIKRWNQSGFSWSYYLNYSDKFTVSEIMKFTPDPSNLFKPGN